MGKRKLRNCARCGVRHGPPTGKGCTRTQVCEAEKLEAVEDDARGQATEFENGGDEMSMTSQEEILTQPEIYDGGATAQEEKKIFSPGAFTNYEERHGEVQWEGSRIPRISKTAKDQARRPSSDFEGAMTDRMNTMENMLGRVAGIQQCQLERLVHLANHPSDVIPRHPETNSF